MPDRNDNNESRGGGNGRRNAFALISVLAWAILITVVFNYLGTMRKQANTTEVEYGVFVQMLEDGKVSKVVMANDKFTIYPKVDAQGNPAPAVGRSPGPYTLPWRAWRRPGSRQPPLPEDYTEPHLAQAPFPPALLFFVQLILNPAHPKFSSVQSLSRVQLFVTPWTAAH